MRVGIIFYSRGGKFHFRLKKIIIFPLEKLKLIFLISDCKVKKKKYPLLEQFAFTLNFNEEKFYILAEYKRHEV